MGGRVYVYLPWDVAQNFHTATAGFGHKRTCGREIDVTCVSGSTYARTHLSEAAYRFQRSAKQKQADKKLTCSWVTRFHAQVTRGRRP